MAKSQSTTKNNSDISLDEIYLENVTLKMLGRDPVLQSVNIHLPIDQTLVIESSNPQNAVYFLNFLAGRMDCESGQILWNGENIFSVDNEVSTASLLSCYFENHFANRSQTVGAAIKTIAAHCDGYDAIEQFDFSDILNVPIKSVSYDLQKTIFLIQKIMQPAQTLILEDPAMGLSEFNWLQILDLIQYQQRRGHFRHVYMTNHHPTALRHLAFNKIFIEDGLIYFDEDAGYKKASHF